MSDLLPCPFCGGEAYLQVVGSIHTKDRGYNIGCNDCHFQKNIRVIRYTLEWCEEQAVKWWNTRKQQPKAEQD